VVEHFSYITKMLRAQNLGFHKELDATGHA